MPRSALTIPRGQDNVVLAVGKREVRLTNLRKIFWAELGLTKGDLLQYYANIADALLPHIEERAMVMKRYPHGAAGEFFFMKRAPSPRPEWIRLCTIDHGNGNIIDFPMIDDLPSLLWVINLGCIDLNQWYAKCDDINRPDYLHFDLDPGRATFDQVRETGLDRARCARRVEDSVAREDHRIERPSRLRADRARAAAERGLDVCQGAGPRAGRTASRADHRRVQSREAAAGRVLVDYNQNAWGRTLASIYSVRPRPDATVSTPVTWKEVEKGIRIEDFTVKNVPARVAKIGDLWKPLLAARGRFDLAAVSLTACSFATSISICLPR